MKILLLLITQNVGGVEKRFYNYCKYIADKTDNNYTVVVSRSLINSLGEIKFDNHNKIKKYGFNWNKKTRFHRYIDYLSILFVLIQVSKKKYDIIHYITGSSLLFEKLLYSKKKVFSCVDSRTEMQDITFTGSIFRRIMNLNFKIDCLDENIQNKIRKYFPDKSGNIFVSPCSFINYQDTDCSNEDKMNTICFAGRLEEFKGIHLLKDILLEIIKQTDFNVVILGKGSYFAKIEEIIIKHDLNGRVKLGYYTDIKHVLRNSVIFLSLQKEENYPSQSLLEAMACKNAIIATDVGLTRKIVKKEFGELIKFDKDDLLNSIKKLSLKPDLLSMGALAREFALSNHNIGKFHNYLMYLYAH